MFLVVKPVLTINEFFNKHGDPRTANLPLMSSPIPTVAIVLFYIYIVRILGPKLMEDRKPFEIKNILLVYNLFQVLLSVYLVYELAMCGWLTGEFSYFCQPVDYSNNPKAIRMMHACWLYYIAKLTELLDTVFFVMRKKFKQVSTLHVIHHSIMPTSWFGVKIAPGGHGTFFGLLNSSVHVVMYGYYFLSALGPNVQKYLWWKKYLTSLQLVQFGLILIHNVPLFFIDCDYPSYFIWVIAAGAVLFCFLFANFYNQTYIKRKSS